MNIDETTAWVFAAISNVAGLIILFACWKRPRVGRWLFFALFSWACWINWNLALTTPAVYLDYSKHALPWYASFIQGFFAEHITAFVGAIATGQGLIAIGMAGRGWALQGACLGAITFLLAIAPLGLYAAFPFSLIVSLAAWLIYRDRTQEMLIARPRNTVSTH